MARIRYLKPDFFKDEDVATLPFEVRLFYQGLWGLADKAGRLEDRPLRLKAEIFPYDNVDAEKCLEQLAKPKQGSGQPFINRYSTDGQRYIQIVMWDKHQKPHHTEKESVIPPRPPLKGMEKGMGTEKQLKASTRLSNGYITVKTPITPFEKTLEKGSTKRFSSFPNSKNLPSGSAEPKPAAPPLPKKQAWKKDLPEEMVMDVEEIHEYFNKKVGATFKLHLNWEYYHKALMNDFTVENCKQAIDGFVANEWAMKNRPDPKWCFDPINIERFMNKGKSTRDSTGSIPI